MVRNKRRACHLICATFANQTMSLYEIQRGQLTGRIYSASKGFYYVSSDSRKNINRQKQTLIQWFFSIFKEIFLPSGYPNTVSNDYLAYQIW